MTPLDELTRGDAPDATPAPPAAVSLAEAFVRQHPECFWFWRTDARIGSLDDVRLVVRHLRDYGGHDAWQAAQELVRCLSPHSRRTS